MSTIVYRQNPVNVDWVEMKETLGRDNWDNGRSPEQLKQSFERSAAIFIAYADDRIIGTVRALSDGVCNAYVVDVWTLTEFRRQGVATTMMRLLLEALPGQHVYLFTDDAPEFYRKLGFEERGTGFGLVVGQWLVNASSDAPR